MGLPVRNQRLRDVISGGQISVAMLFYYYIPCGDMFDISAHLACSDESREWYYAPNGVKCHLLRLQILASEKERKK